MRMPHIVVRPLATILVAAVLVGSCAAPSAPQLPTASEKPSSAAPAAPKVELTRGQQVVEEAKREGEVMFWTNSFLDDGDRMKKAFKEKYPFLEFRVWDGPTGPAVLNKVVEEAKVGKHTVDVLILVGGDASVPLASGMLVEYDWPNVKGWPNQPTNSFMKAIAGSSYGPVYNTNLVSAAEAPRSFEALKDPKWRGRGIMSVSARDTPLFFAYQWREGEKLSWDKSFDFWRTVVKNTQPRVVSGITGPLEMISAGETPIFLWGTFASAVRLIWKGAPLGMAKLELAPTVSYFVMVMKNAPHPNAGRLFADFLTSAEGSAIYADQHGRLAYNPEANKRGRANQTLNEAGINPVTLPMEVLTEENYRKSSDFWYSVLGRTP